MKSLDIFFNNREIVLTEWINSIFNTYPLQTTGFLRTIKDPFTNPVGDMTKEAAQTVYEAVSGWDKKPDDVKKAIDRFVHLRAVQAYLPSQAIMVFYLLKPVMRKHILPLLRANDSLDDYLAAESRLDTIILMALDIYMQSRETVAENRIHEIKNQYAQLVRWAQRVGGSPLENEGKS